MEGRLLALRQTTNKRRGHRWIVEHRAVRTELEKAWDVHEGNLRDLDEDLCKAMDDWDHRHLTVSDNIMIAGHVIEAIKRHREVEQALSQSPTADEPRACFYAWWLRPYRCFLGVGGFLDCALLGPKDFLDYGHLAVKSGIEDFRSPHGYSSPHRTTPCEQPRLRETGHDISTDGAPRATCKEPTLASSQSDLDDSGLADWFLSLLGMSSANSCDQDGWTPLHFAIQATAYWSVAQRICTGLIGMMDETWLRAKITGGRMASYAPIHCAANGSDRLLERASLLKRLVEARADIGQRDSQGRTAFLHAVGTGVVDSAQMLHKLGADVHAVSADGRNARDRCRGSSHQMRRFLTVFVVPVLSCIVSWYGGGQGHDHEINIQKTAMWLATAKPPPTALPSTGLPADCVRRPPGKCVFTVSLKAHVHCPLTMPMGGHWTPYGGIGALHETHDSLESGHLPS